ncbi:MAG: hypothetical protein AAB445_01070 [Patescibacteria group bacterium]
MGEREHNPQEGEQVDRFGLTKERRLETVGTNIDLTLRRCDRLHVQPRDMLLRAYGDREGLQEELGPAAEELLDIMANLPDYNLADPADRTAASQAIAEIFSHVVEAQFARDPKEQAAAQEAEKQWKRAGIFAYEVVEDGNLVIHVPPMAEAPTASQLKESLQQLAVVLEEQPGIAEIHSSSLLLEHPIAKRFGFTIEPESDGEFSPSFHIAREDFLKRFHA